jgi:pimeloyl-ACP methyl ester carboxylesterase
VVICHGFLGCKDWGFVPVLAERLARAGLTAISFDFSGSGVGSDGGGFSEKDRFAHSTLTNDVLDIATVCKSLAEGTLVEGLVKSSNYGLFGYSRGGGASVIHAAANPAVRGLVTWAAICHMNRWDSDTVVRWRSEGKRYIRDAGMEEDLFFYTDMLDDLEENRKALDFTSAAGKVSAPWLILHGDADSFVPVEEGRSLFHAAKPGVARLEVIESGTHSFGAQHLVRAIDSTLAWFSRHLY